MHADEVDIDDALVRRLLAAQFPQWSQLPLARCRSAGTDNAIYRLGDELCVRLPRLPAATAQVDKEQQWLPKLALHLPLAIPAPVAMGTPAQGYPWNWSVYRWLDGENATLERIADPCEAATDLARFIIALRGVDPTGGPAPGQHNFYRGVPLAMRDPFTRNAIAQLHGLLDIDAATAAWEAALCAPTWQAAPVWIHGDLQSGNLLAQRGRLSAVIDFGGLAIGDPACDLLVAWNLFTGESRDAFRAALSVDDAAWARGRGWALSTGLVALAYYLETNPVLAEISRRGIDEVLADHERRA